MDINKISRDDLLGRVFLIHQGPQEEFGYFKCLEAIRPILRIENFLSQINVYYINVAGSNNGYFLNGLRLSFFSPSPSEIVFNLLDDFCLNNGLQIINKELLHSENFEKDYGGGELNFRRFLYHYTQIGLDLVDYNLLYARQLVAKHRIDNFIQRFSCRPLFEPAFVKHSPYYNNLDKETKEQLWKNLDFWYNNTDWAHLFVNMLLPGDTIFQEWARDQRETKRCIKEQWNIVLPEDWQP